MSTWPRPWNFNAVVVGLPGDGKTTLVQRVIAQHLRTTPGIVLAHDPHRQYTRLGCVHYADANAYRAAVRAAHKAGKPLPRGASIGGDNGDAVTELALEVGERAGNTAERVVRPVLVPFDESIEREGSGSTFASKLDKRFLTGRRHRGIGGIYNVQDTTLLTAVFFRMSTDVVLFQIPSNIAREMDTKLYLEPGTLVRAGVTRLGPHQHVRVKLRVGVVPGVLSTDA